MTPFQRFLIRRRARRPDSPRRDEMLAELLSGIGGCVIEVGCGTGFLFSHYPSTVTELTAIEPESEAREAAICSAAQLNRSVRILDLADQRLPVESGTFDAAVCFEVLCSAKDSARLLSEIKRVLRPGGTLRIVEHVRSQNPAFALFQRVVDRVGWPRLLGGCHTSRDTQSAIEDAGFEWIKLRRIWHAPMIMLTPAAPHIVGCARPVI
jgi:SAM-dependent methyltransferase